MVRQACAVVVKSGGRMFAAGARQALHTTTVSVCFVTRAYIYTHTHTHTAKNSPCMRTSVVH
jgi:hypothetical protein